MVNLGKWFRTVFKRKGWARKTYEALKDKAIKVVNWGTDWWKTGGSARVKKVLGIAGLTYGGAAAGGVGISLESMFDEEVELNIGDVHALMCIALQATAKATNQADKDEAAALFNDLEARLKASDPDVEFNPNQCPLILQEASEAEGDPSTGGGGAFGGGGSAGWGGGSPESEENWFREPGGSMAGAGAGQSGGQIACGYQGPVGGASSRAQEWAVLRQVASALGVSVDRAQLILSKIEEYRALVRSNG